MCCLENALILNVLRASQTLGRVRDIAAMAAISSSFKLILNGIGSVYHKRGNMPGPSPIPYATRYIDVAHRLTMMAFVLAVLIAGALRQMGHQRAIRQWTHQTGGPERTKSMAHRPWPVVQTNSPPAMKRRFRFCARFPVEPEAQDPGTACRKESDSPATQKTKKKKKKKWQKISFYGYAKDRTVTSWPRITMNRNVLDGSISFLNFEYANS